MTNCPSGLTALLTVHRLWGSYCYALICLVSQDLTAPWTGELTAWSPEIRGLLDCTLLLHCLLSDNGAHNLLNVIKVTRPGFEPGTFPLHRDSLNH